MRWRTEGRKSRARGFVLFSFALIASSLIGCRATSIPPHSVAERTALDRELLPPPLPDRRYGAGGHRVGDEWIVFGGTARGNNAERETWVYAPESKRWRAGPLLTHRHNFVGSVQIENDIYAVGEAIERYDREVDAWEVVHVSEQIPRSHSFATGLAGEIYVIGGFPAERGSLQIFDLETGELRAGPPLPGFRPGDHFILLATLDGGVHAVGGLGEGSDSIATQHFRLEGGAWTARAPHPTGVTGKFTTWCAHRGRLYVFEQEGHVYDPKTDRWTSLAAPPPPRVLPVVIGLEDRLVVLGGLEPSEQKNEAWVYEIEFDRWRRLEAAAVSAEGDR